MRNSKRTRVEPVFRALATLPDRTWPERLLKLADGLGDVPPPGPLVRRPVFSPERKVRSSPERLAWMLRHAERLVPRDGARFREWERRVLRHPRRAEALTRLEAGTTRGVPRALMLEGATHADCLIWCERVVIWVEGKRDDWLDPSITWDVARDQLARDLEAAWRLGRETNKDACLLVCHEDALRLHEEALIRGYRAGTWSAGWPHLDEATRRHLGSRIGTVTWRAIVDAWPILRDQRALRDIGR